MIKKYVVFILSFMLVVLSSYAQVGINNSGSNPDSSAILDLNSNAKGLLIPRMTNSQIRAIQSPANSLMVYSTTDNKFYVYRANNKYWKELSFGPSTIHYPATYSLGSGQCSNVLVNGSYVAANPLTGSETIKIDVFVNKQGAYNICTDTVNGYSFSKSGVFNSTGVQAIVLNGSGTPISTGTDNFTVKADTGSTTCSFTINVSLFTPLYPSGTVHCVVAGANIVDATNPGTGDTWMDRNLGASRVAQSGGDSQAYGGLYQWGRFSDGHQCRSSNKTNSLATTELPNTGQSWDGKFIKEKKSPYDWLLIQKNSLWQGVNGTNNPCPYGYRLPTETELDSERQSWSSNDASGAFGSPLKLTMAGYRFHKDGWFNEVGASGYYWSSTVNGNNAYGLSFNSGGAGINTAYRANGFSIRCIKD